MLTKPGASCIGDYPDKPGPLSARPSYANCIYKQTIGSETTLREEPGDGERRTAGPGHDPIEGSGRKTIEEQSAGGGVYIRAAVFGAGFGLRATCTRASTVAEGVYDVCEAVIIDGRLASAEKRRVSLSADAGAGAEPTVLSSQSMPGLSSCTVHPCRRRS